MAFSAVVVFATLVPVIVCDYQLEVNLLSYNNSARRLQNGQCCDLRNPSAPQAPCLPQDSCDVRFTFSVQNFNTLVTFNSQTKVLGTYDNSDMIIFAECSTLMNDVSNPLVFEIPTNAWNAGEDLRIQAEINDVDQISGLEFILSSNPIATIPRPSAPSSQYSSTQTFTGPNSLTLVFQYRIICTVGTCGSSCSQTTNCSPFSSCTPVTCADSPCQNGGTCSDATGSYFCQCPTQCNPPNCAVCDDPCLPMNPCFNGGTCNAQGSSFSCTCREGYTGDTCRTVLIPESATTSNTPVTTTAAMTTVPDTSVNTYTSTIMVPDAGVNSTMRSATANAVQTMASCVLQIAGFTLALSCI